LNAGVDAMIAIFTDFFPIFGERNVNPPGSIQWTQRKKNLSNERQNFIPWNSTRVHLIFYFGALVFLWRIILFLGINRTKNANAQISIYTTASAGLEPGSSVPESDAMATAHRFFLIFFKNLFFSNTLNNNAYVGIKFWQQHCNVYKALKALHPGGIFCSVGGRDDHYVTPPWPAQRFLTSSSTLSTKSRTSLRIRSCSRRSTRITWNNVYDDYNIDPQGPIL
jgi:hypothetical protein